MIGAVAITSFVAMPRAHDRTASARNVRGWLDCQARIEA